MMLPTILILTVALSLAAYRLNETSALKPDRLRVRVRDRNNRDR